MTYVDDGMRIRDVDDNVYPITPVSCPTWESVLCWRVSTTPWKKIISSAQLYSERITTSINDLCGTVD